MSETVVPTTPPRAAALAPRVSTQVREEKAVRSRTPFSELWTSLPVAWVLASRDLKIKYKQSLLGPIWLVLQPAGLLIAFAVVFTGVTTVDTGGVPYALFALVGLIVWSYLQASLITGTTTMILNATLIRRLACPRLAFPTSGVITGFPILVVTIVPAMVATYALGYHLSLRALLLPVALLWLLVFTWGCVTLVSAIGSRYRDLVGIMPFALQAGVFISPVAYPASEAPKSIEGLLALNPVAGIIEFWRWVFLPDAELDLLYTATALGWTALVLVGGWLVFTRWETTMADYV